MAQPFFTIVDDDAASTEAILSVKKVADRRGVKVSYAVCSDRLLQDSVIIKVLLDYQNQGHHICNHSLTHNAAVWKNPRMNDVKLEIERSEAILDSLGFNHHDYFVYPYGKYSDSVYSWMIPLVSSYFKMAFESRGYGNDTHSANRYSIARFPLRKHDNWFVVKSIIDCAVANGYWLVFMNHSSLKRDYSEERLEEVITYCQDKGMKCLNIHEAWEQGLIVSAETQPFMWTTYDEVIYILYTHIGWLLLFASLLTVVLFIWWRKRRRYCE